jgi:hypothetical protein
MCCGIAGAGHEMLRRLMAVAPDVQFRIQKRGPLAAAQSLIAQLQE